MNTPTAAANFDPIGRIYRWLEYVTFGRSLERCRTYFLPTLPDRCAAIVFGDGDGRFLSRLLAANRHVQADVIDTSEVMLKLLTRRAGGDAIRLRTHQVDALGYAPTRTYDLIITHFFVDCLTQSELDTLALRMARHAAADTLWLLSDFRVPSGPMHWPARILVRLLYLAFRLITGLRTTHLPDHAAALTAAGFTLSASHHSIAGVLTTEIWALDSPTAKSREAHRQVPLPQIRFPMTAELHYTPTMQLPPQRPKAPHPPDPVPDPEPPSPSLPEPDPDVFHHEPPVPASK